MRKVFAAAALMFLSSMNAQSYDLGKVTIEELQEKSHPLDTSAVAAILFKKGLVNYDYSSSEGFIMTTKVEARIKIYKKEGYEWANHQIQHYIGHNAKEDVSFRNAVTYNLVNGKVEKSKLKSDGEFEENINKYWALKKIALPNVKEGSVIEFEYIIRSKNVTEIRPWDFQSSIPVNYSEFRTFIPEYFVYNAVQKGYVYPKVIKSAQHRTIEYTSKDRHINGGPTIVSNEKLAFVENRTTYTAQSLPAMRDEAYVNNISNYTSAISHELAMLRMPQQTEQSFATNWSTVTKKIYEDSDFGPELKKTGYFEDDIKALTQGMTDQTEVANAIFGYVKSTMKWNNYTGYSCNEGVRHAYKSKLGNVAEINLMLTAMLRSAGINANPVLISTRSNGIALFPNRTAFNYVITAVETPTGILLYDATEKYATANVLPLRDLNWFGRLIREDGSSTEIDLVPNTLSKEITNIMMSPQPDGTVTGKIRSQYSDQDALLYRLRHAGTNVDTYIENLQNSHNNIEVTDYVRENELDLTKSVSETFSFADKNSIEIIGDRMYISPLLFFSETSNPFRQETREYPVDFSYPQQRKYSIIIEIPAGYVVESLPQILNVAMEENRTAFRYNIASTANKIQLNIISDVNHAIFPAPYYPGLKAYFQQVVDKQSEKIILKKV